MATNWILLACALATVVSQTETQRVINHVLFRYLTFTTTPSTTTGLQVDVKEPDPDVKFPSKNDIFLNYLINRKSYFKDNGWENNGNTVRPSKPSSSLTTESTKKQVTTNAPVTRINSQPVSEDRPQSRQPTTKKPEGQPNLEKNRESDFSLTDLWFQNIMRKPVLQNSWGRPSSTKNEPIKQTNTPPSRDPPSKVEVTMATTPSQTGINVASTASESDSKDRGNGVNDRPTDSPADDVTGGRWVEITGVDVQDKPLFDADLDRYFPRDNLEKGGLRTSTESETKKNEGAYRYRRAANETGNGTSCSDPAQFQTCQYYPRCFQEIEGRCKSRDSFIGDEVNRFCAKTTDTSLAAQSEQLRTYLRKVDECVRDELSTIVESPSCDDVTIVLTRTLLVKSTTSCFYQNGVMCNILEDNDARPGLARILNSQTVDVDFMSRLMVNIGDLASYCRGQGASIFVTDITVLATSKDGPFKEKYSHSPISIVVEKN